MAEEILAAREPEYQDALQIARNDLLTREDQLRELSLWLEDLGYSDPQLYEDLATKISSTRRARRDVVSEGSYLFENDLLNYLKSKKADTLKLERSVNLTEGKERQKSQPIPGSEAHHPASVSSTESLVQNMREDEIRKLWNIAKEEGYVVGSQAEGFIPLSKPAHTTGGKTRGTAYAHVGVTGEPDPGRFKTDPLPRNTTAEEAWKSLKPMLDEQIELNKIAFEHPTEQVARQRAAEAMGTELQFGGSDFDTLQEQRKLAKERGVNLTTISKSFDKYPGLAETGLVPGVDVMTDVGSTVPRALGGKQGGYEARRGLAQNGGKVRFSRTRQLVKGATKVIPGPVDDLLVGGAMAAAAAGGVLITGGSPAQAAQAAADTGIDYATGDLSGGDLAPATITDSQRNPTTYGLKGPDMSQPPMSTSSADILTDPTTKPQQPKSAAAKIIDDPLNELEYASKQVLRGIKKIGGAILFGF